MGTGKCAKRSQKSRWGKKTQKTTRKRLVFKPGPKSKPAKGLCVNQPRERKKLAKGETGLSLREYKLRQMGSGPNGLEKSGRALGKA